MIDGLNCRATRTTFEPGGVPLAYRQCQRPRVIVCESIKDGIGAEPSSISLRSWNGTSKGPFVLAARHCHPKQAHVVRRRFALTHPTKLRSLAIFASLRETSDRRPCRCGAKGNEPSIRGGNGRLVEGNSKGEMLEVGLSACLQQAGGTAPDPLQDRVGLGPLQDRVGGPALSKADPRPSALQHWVVLSSLNRPFPTLLLRSVVGDWGLTLRNGSYAGAVPNRFASEEIVRRWL